MVERAGLENRCTLMGTEGSNPSLSARRVCTTAGRNGRFHSAFQQCVSATLQPISVTSFEVTINLRRPYTPNAIYFNANVRRLDIFQGVLACGNWWRRWRPRQLRHQTDDRVVPLVGESSWLHARD